MEEEHATKAPLPDTFLQFLETNGLDPSIYTAIDSTPRYIRLSLQAFQLPDQWNLTFLRKLVGQELSCFKSLADEHLEESEVEFSRISVSTSCSLGGFKFLENAKDLPTISKHRPKHDIGNMRKKGYFPVEQLGIDQAIPSRILEIILIIELDAVCFVVCKTLVPKSLPIPPLQINHKHKKHGHNRTRKDAVSWVLRHLQRILKAHIFGEEDLTQITFTLNLPLSFIFLIHIQVSDLLFGKITHDAKDLTETLPGTPQHQKLLDTFSSDWATFFLFKLLYFVSLLIFSLLSTSAIVYTVASFYTGKEVTFKKVLSVVPKLWKRLMVTFLCTVVAFFAYNVIEVLVLGI
ncbi:hypothetical protein JHK86_015082 [Glycine max]|nr:hypothetical protein JHK86_015082 [Glycine max]